MNLAQRITVHYFNPFNAREFKGVLLNHSAGSGKSATAALAASTWVRENHDRIVIWVTKPGLEHIGREGIMKQTDFNVQQYTQGIPLVDKVETDLSKLFRHHKQTLSQEDALAVARECLLMIGSLEVDRHNYYCMENLLASTTTNPQKKAGKDKKLQKLHRPQSHRESTWKPCDVMIDRCKSFSQKQIDNLRDKLFDDQASKMLLGATIYTEQKIIEGVMGIQWKFMTYNQFARMGGAGMNACTTDINYKKPLPIFHGGGTWREYMRQGIRSTPDRSQDPFRDCLVVVDEAHLLAVSEKLKGDIQESECFLKRFLNIAYSSDAHSDPEHACKWMLLTATAIVDNPVDLINLLLLLNTRAMAQKHKFLAYIDVGPRRGDPKNKKAKATKEKFTQNFQRCVESWQVSGRRYARFPRNDPRQSLCV